MGIEYFVVCDESRDLFELGKGSWWDIDLVLETHKDDKNTFVDTVMKKWMSITTDNEESREYGKELGERLWSWCSKRNWLVSLESDSRDDERLYEYTVTESRYEEDAEDEHKDRMV